jgi:signal transduction histidine kinase
LAEWYERTPGRFAQLREVSGSVELGRGGGFLARVFETTAPELVNDAGEFPPARREVMLRSGVRAMAAFPAMVGDEVVAVLEFFSAEPMEDDERIIECMVNMGVQLGRVVERKRLEKQIAEMASHEQQRIGRELHDTVTQQLTGAEMMLEGLRQRLENQSSPHVQQAARIGQVVKDAQHQVRRLSRGLMPVEVDAAGLMNALQDLTDQTEQMHGIACDFQCDDDVFIRDSAAATQLYRIAQEAIHNAVKHAQPTRIAVSLSANDRFRLTVQDDGVGVSGLGAERRGEGLRIMRYRAEVIGGRLEIASDKDAGTRVTCELRRA